MDVKFSPKLENKFCHIIFKINDTDTWCESAGGFWWRCNEKNVQKSFLMRERDAREKEIGKGDDDGEE